MLSSCLQSTRGSSRSHFVSSLGVATNSITKQLIHIMHTVILCAIPVFCSQPHDGKPRQTQRFSMPDLSERTDLDRLNQQHFLCSRSFYHASYPSYLFQLVWNQRRIVVGINRLDKSLRACLETVQVDHSLEAFDQVCIGFLSAE